MYRSYTRRRAFRHHCLQIVLSAALFILSSALLTHPFWTQ